MTDSVYAIYGASGFGREVMPLAKSQLATNQDSKLYFVDDNSTVDNLNGQPVITYQQFLELQTSIKYISIAIADATIRERLTQRCLNDGLKIWSLTAANCVVMDQVDMGEGSILCPFVTLTSNIKIGSSFHANIYSYVAHDCVVGDFVTFAPAVKCNGNVIIEDYAYIGTGAVIKQGKPNKPIIIGKGAVVGMGAVVTKNVQAGTVVIGNPAKPLSRKGLGG